MNSSLTRYQSRIPTAVFPRALQYLHPTHHALQVQDPRALPGPDTFTERHIQCVWYDPALRPRELRTSDGETVEVIDPGTWNQEAGPDFIGAVLRVGSEGRRVAGDVEVHLTPSGWTQHGHADDPRYHQVRCHVTYAPGVLPAGVLPPGTLQLSLRDALLRDPTFALETIDVTAYPYGVRATEPPCRLVLRDWNADQRGAILDAAGEERLRRKSERLRLRIDEAGADQVLYEELLTALGYKHNKRAFRSLAVTLPLHTLRELAQGDILHAYALLAGVSGLLPDTPDESWSPEARRFVRTVWDHWWRARDTWSARALRQSDWILHSLRPANHPLRRLMAAAAIAIRRPTLEEQWAEASPAQAAASITGLTGPFWPDHLSLGSQKRPRPVALIGPDRVRAILVNLFVPYRAALGEAPDTIADFLQAVPKEGDHQILRQTAHHLFGPDHSPSQYATGLRRQGVVQIFHDFCLLDRSRCATCPFPKLLQQFRGERP